MLDIEGLLGGMEVRGQAELYLRAGSRPVERVDGELRPVDGSAEMSPDEVAEVVEALLPGKVRERLDGTGHVDFAKGVAGVGRFRVTAVRQRGTTMLVLRRVRLGVPDLATLGLPDAVGEMAAETGGLLVVGGPRGSGVSTTVAAVVDRVNSTRPGTIVTVERPIEVLHKDKVGVVIQREIGTDAPSYREAMEALDGLSPDTVVVGELDSAETAWAAMEAANGGQLVVTTMRVQNASEAVNRLVTTFPEERRASARRMLASCLVGVVVQHLVWSVDGRERLPAVEVLVGTDEVLEGIRDPDSEDDYEQRMVTGLGAGMQSLDQTLVYMYADGLISAEEAVRVATWPSRLKDQIRGLVPKDRSAPPEPEPEPEPVSAPAEEPGAGGGTAEELPPPPARARPAGTSLTERLRQAQQERSGG